MLIRRIRDKIAAAPCEAITFRDFMDMCLYDPQDGYYMRDAAKIGKEGDFYTSVHIGGIFGEVLGRFAIRQLREYEGPVHFVEWGGGTGKLAAIVMNTIRQTDAGLYERLTFTMVESSGYHQSLQQEALAAHAGKVRFVQPSEWQRVTLTEPAVVFANELLDAFAVHRIRRTKEGIREIYVAWDGQKEAFKEMLLPLSDGRLADYLEKYGISLRPGQTAEINLAAENWLRREAGRLTEGMLLLVDYGDTAEELYGPHRMNGTLMCYRRHAAHDNPYVHIGEQDMTAHVNFTSCLRVGEESGLTDGRLLTQKRFLLENGIMELLAGHESTDPFSPEARRNRAIRQLLVSDQMSELFKVCMLSKKR